MKKFLSLVLALVMTMSLVTVSAGAKDFTDDSKINYEEAVAVMSELKVLGGYTDGSFNPQGNLTRQAAAKIICNMILGPTTASALRADTAPFKDVPATNEFAGYITYCAQQGIISGYADGEFKPGNPLTGYAFMKMLLGALGYDAQVEGYVGANWSVQVAKRAIGIGLNAGLKDTFNGVKTVNREEATLYAFNTLKATMVEYDSRTTVSVGGAEVVIAGSAASDVAQNGYKDTMDAGNLQFAEKYFPKLSVDPSEDEFMRPANKWTYNKKEVGTFVDYTLKVGEFTTALNGKDLADLLGKSTIADNDVEYYIDGAPDTTITAKNMVKTNTKNYSKTGKGVLTEVFFNKDDEQITITSINTYLAFADGDYDEDEETLGVDMQAPADKCDTEVTLDEFAGIEDMKDGDAFLVNVAFNGTDYDIVAISDVEVTEDAKLTKYSQNSYVVSDGEQYDYAMNGHCDGALNDVETYGSSALDNTYNLYFDAYGYLIGAEKVTGDSKYVFITGYDYSTSSLTVQTAKAAAIFLDGDDAGVLTPIEVNVNKTQEKIDAYNVHATNDYKSFNNVGGRSEMNSWFTYTVNKNGVYTLEPVDNWMNVKYAENTKLNSYKVVLRDTDKTDIVGEGKGVRCYGNDDSVYFTVETAAVSAATTAGISKVTATYTGAQNIDLTVLSHTDADYGLKATSANSVFAVYDDNLYIIGAVVVGEDTTSTRDYAYALKGANKEYTDGDFTYWDFTAVVDGKIVELTVKGDKDNFDAVQDAVMDHMMAVTTTPTATAKNGLMKMVYDKDGYVIDVELLDDNNDTDGIYSNVDYGKETDPDDFSVYTLTYTTGGEANFKNIGRTLYGHATDAGLTVAENAPIIVVQAQHWADDNTTEVTYKAYSSYDKAIKALEGKGQNFTGWVSAVLNDRGTAEYVVIANNAVKGIDNNNGEESTGKSAITKVVLTANGDATLTGAAAGKSYKYSLLQYAAGQNDYVEIQVGTLSCGATGVVTTADPICSSAMTAGHSYKLVVDGVASAPVYKAS